MANYAHTFVIAALTATVALAQNNETKAPSNPGDSAQRRNAVRAGLETHMKELERQGFSGVLRFRYNGEVVIDQGYGFADEAKKAPMKPDMVFDLSSITKNFTLAGVLVLVSENKVKLPDTLPKFFKNVPDDKQAITVEQLLRHTSGLPQVFGADEDIVPKDDILKKALGCKLLSAPGADFNYSDVGYALLAMIIEEVSGKSYEAFLQERVFGPAGLKATGSVLPDWSKVTLVEGWRNGKHWGTVRDYFDKDGPSWNIRGAGGIMSTAAELDAWFDAFLHYKIGSRALVDLYLAAVVERSQRNTRFISASGNNAIFSSIIFWWLDDNASLVLLCNSSEWPYDKVIGRIIEKVNPIFETGK